MSWDGKADSSPAHGSPGACATPERWAAGDGSLMLRGDNLEVLYGLRETHAGQVTLAYLDPPFLTNRVHKAKDRETGAERVAFDDRWADRAAYLEALAPRLVAVRELLAPHGSIVIHVDPKTSHYVKVLATRSLARRRSLARSSGAIGAGRPRRRTSSASTTCCSVTGRTRQGPRWNQLYEPLAASTLATWGTNKQRAVFATEMVSARARRRPTSRRRACRWGTSGTSASSRRSLTSGRATRRRSPRRCSRASSPR